MALGAAHDQDQALVSAILSAFDEQQLSALLRFKGGLVLEQEVDTARGFKYIAQDVVTLLHQNDDIGAFIALALTEKPNNPLLKSIAAERGIVQPSPPVSLEAAATVRDFIAAAQRILPADPALDAVAVQVGPPLATPADSLEALIARRSKQIDFARFEQRLEAIRMRTCLIRTPCALGTGFLVGTDRVLTNYHVVEGLIEGDYATTAVVCEFDFNNAMQDIVRVTLAGTPLASAPYGKSDVGGGGEPADNELDFALLPLSSAIGTGPRGFYVLDPHPRLLALGDFLFVCQHANGQALTLAMGTITGFPGKAMRLRYDATTDHGASGSPCFNPDLDLIGLHHAADAALNPTYNQAVPIWLVARAIETASRT